MEDVKSVVAVKFEFEHRDKKEQNLKLLYYQKLIQKPKYLIFSLIGPLKQQRE